jgi:hypothetical protein
MDKRAFERRVGRIGKITFRVDIGGMMKYRLHILRRVRDRFGAVIARDYTEVEFRYLLAANFYAWGLRTFLAGDWHFWVTEVAA